MGIILTILAFNFIILIHELGHFVVARLTGIKVLEFSLFIGPKLWSIKKGDTEYSIRLIPMLAYVAMEGEDKESNDEGAFYKKSVWARMATIAGGPIANLLSALVILLIVFSKTGYKTTQIDMVRAKSPAYTAGLKPGDEIVYCNGKRVYLPTDLVQFLYIDKGDKATLSIYRDGKRQDVDVTTQIINDGRYVLGITSSQQGDSTIIGDIAPGSAASEAGVLIGDKVIALNDVLVSDIYDIIEYVNEYTSEKGSAPIETTILRNGKEIKLSITPKLLKGQPSVNLGISFASHKGNLMETLGHSAKYIWANVKNVGYTIKWLVTGHVSVNEMSGPIGIFTTMKDATSLSETFSGKILNLLNMTAFISVAIGATNLVPFPALDGSKLVFLIIEAITKKPIPPEKEARVSSVGLIILMLLLVVITFNDILKIIIRIRG